ncbi:MAG: hypothetical protein WA397_04775 [Roseiarcus sp.]|jgi:hypothetical protein
MGSGSRADCDVYGEALRVFREKREPEAALVSLMERGFAGVNAALAGTPYV